MEANLPSLLKELTSPEGEKEELFTYLYRLVSTAKRNVIKELVQILKNIIQSPKTSADEKFWALYTLKEMSYTGRIEFYEEIEKTVLNDLFILAQHRKEVPGIERGRTIFKALDPNADETASESFFQLLLETFTEWINNYSMNADQEQPSDFVKRYNDLLRMGVNFPDVFQFEGSAFQLERKELFKIPEAESFGRPKVPESEPVVEKKPSKKEEKKPKMSKKEQKKAEEQKEKEMKEAESLRTLQGEVTDLQRAFDSLSNRNNEILQIYRKYEAETQNSGATPETSLLKSKLESLRARKNEFLLKSTNQAQNQAQSAGNLQQLKQTHSSLANALLQIKLQTAALKSGGPLPSFSQTTIPIQPVNSFVSKTSYFFDKGDFLPSITPKAFPSVLSSSHKPLFGYASMRKSVPLTLDYKQSELTKTSNDIYKGLLRSPLGLGLSSSKLESSSFSSGPSHSVCLDPYPKFKTLELNTKSEFPSSELHYSSPPSNLRTYQFKTPLVSYPSYKSSTFNSNFNMIDYKKDISLPFTSKIFNALDQRKHSKSFMRIRPSSSIGFTERYNTEYFTSSTKDDPIQEKHRLSSSFVSTAELSGSHVFQKETDHFVQKLVQNAIGSSSLHDTLRSSSSARSKSSGFDSRHSFLSKSTDSFRQHQKFEINSPLAKSFFLTGKLLQLTQENFKSFRLACVAQSEDLLSDSSIKILCRASRGRNSLGIVDYFLRIFNTSTANVKIRRLSSNDQKIQTTLRVLSQHSQGEFVCDLRPRESIEAVARVDYSSDVFPTVRTASLVYQAWGKEEKRINIYFPLNIFLMFEVSSSLPWDLKETTLRRTSQNFALMSASKKLCAKRLHETLQNLRNYGFYWRNHVAFLRSSLLSDKISITVSTSEDYRKPDSLVSRLFEFFQNLFGNELDSD